MAGSSVKFAQKHRDSKSSTKATSYRKTTSRTSVFDRRGSPTATTTQRTVTQEPPFRAGAGRGARHRPYPEPLPPPPPPLPPTDTRTVPETPYTTPRPSPARSLSWSEESLDSFHGFGTEASLGNLPSNPYWLYLNDRYTFQLDIQHICVPFICQTDAYTLCFHFHFVCIFMFIFPKLAFFNRKLINHGTDVNDGAYFASNHG